MPEAMRLQGEGEAGSRSRGWPGPCRYIARGREKVRPGTGREPGLGHVGSDVEGKSVNLSFVRATL
jgi:hypothetical protein